MTHRPPVTLTLAILCVFLMGCARSRNTRFVISPADVGRTAQPELLRADAGRLRFFTALYANYLGFRDITEQRRSPDLLAWWAAGNAKQSSFMIARAEGDELVLYVRQRAVLIDAWPFVTRRATWEELTDSLRHNLGQAYHGRIREIDAEKEPAD